MRGGCMPHGMRGIAFFQEHSRVLGPRNGNILFINLFDAGNCHLRMGLAGKDICICLSGTPCFYQIPFQKDSAGACDYDPAGFIPFSSDCQFIQIFFLKEISCCNCIILFFLSSFFSSATWPLIIAAGVPSSLEYANTPSLSNSIFLTKS